MDSTPDPRLVRLQILTPLSVLISLGANLVGTLAIKPGAGQINDDLCAESTLSRLSGQPYHPDASQVAHRRLHAARLRPADLLLRESRRDAP